MVWPIGPEPDPERKSQGEHLAQQNPTVGVPGLSGAVNFLLLRYVPADCAGLPAIHSPRLGTTLAHSASMR
jgi:hypothetical protein